jgi:hypothetical protein
MQRLRYEMTGAPGPQGPAPKINARQRSTARKLLGDEMRMESRAARHAMQDYRSSPTGGRRIGPDGRQQTQYATQFGYVYR